MAKGVEARVIRSLRVLEGRGYNLTLEELAERAIGGGIPLEELRNIVLENEEMEYDGRFVGLKDSLFSEKCRLRRRSHVQLEGQFGPIADEFASDLMALCPWVRCVLASGSLATGGLGKEDDIDLSLVVEDETKYLTYLIALMLSLRFSMRYGKAFAQRYLGRLPTVICINVIWEESQTFPFIRRDDQMAWELFNSKVLRSKPFYDMMISRNVWLADTYPQMFDEIERFYEGMGDGKRRFLLRPFNLLARIGTYLLFQLIRVSRDGRERTTMERNDSVKSPYGIFDVPGRAERKLRNQL
jgi:hypothetical protein